jgi:hypothetical protein
MLVTLRTCNVVAVTDLSFVNEGICSMPYKYCESHSCKSMFVNYDGFQRE